MFNAAEVLPTLKFPFFFPNILKKIHIYIDILVGILGTKYYPIMHLILSLHSLSH